MSSNPAYPMAYKLNKIFRQNTICLLRVARENLNSTKDLTYLINLAYSRYEYFFYNKLHCPAG